jgi:hypothetical protein
VLEEMTGGCAVEDGTVAAAAGGTGGGVAIPRSILSCSIHCF